MYLNRLLSLGHLNSGALSIKRCISRDSTSRVANPFSFACRAIPVRVLEPCQVAVSANSRRGSHGTLNQTHKGGSCHVHDNRATVDWMETCWRSGTRIMRMLLRSVIAWKLSKCILKTEHMFILIIRSHSHLRMAIVYRTEPLRRASVGVRHLCHQQAQ
jgi:hypothetical protein